MKRDSESGDPAVKSHTGTGLVIGSGLAVGMGIGLGTVLSSVAMVTVGAVAGVCIGVAIGHALDWRAWKKAIGPGSGEDDMGQAPSEDA